MTSSYFLDTSYAIAFLSTRDEFHSRAKQLALAIETHDIQLLTTRAILLEIGNSLAYRNVRRQGLDFLRSINSDNRVRIVELHEELYERAVDLFESRMDKEWGLVDCLSFVVMAEAKVEAALTTDRHFVQAGFRALLREE